MKGVKNFIYSTIIAATTLFSSCEKPESEEPLIPSKETPTEQPANNSSNNDLYDNAYVFEDSDLEKIVSYDYFTIGFSSPQEFSVGDIISGGISEKTPYGFLHKITYATSDKKSFKVDLNTSLDEAVKNGEGSFSKAWTYGDLKSAPYNTNISLQSGNSSHNFHVDVDEIIHDEDGNPNTTLDQMVLKGYSDFNIFTELKTKITEGKVYTRFESTINGKSNFQLVTDLELLNIDKKIPLQQYYFNPIVFSIGPVPVVILPKASLNFYFDANLNSKIDAEFSNDFSYKNILELKDGNWTLTKDPSNYFDTKISETKIDFNANTSASLSPEVSLELYGLAGPYANIKLGITFDANTENNPWWTWSIWANANIGFDITKISKNAKNFEKTIPLLEDIIIKQADGAFPGSGEGGGGEDSETVTLYDARDGQTYKTVKIGDQWWMAENLNVGLSIDCLDSLTDNGIIEKKCPGGIEDNCKIYGGLYSWDEMMQYHPSDDGSIGSVQGVCPSGWHIPTKNEWEILLFSLGGESIAGGKLKEEGIIHWDSPNLGATNSSGFTALPAEYSCWDPGTSAAFWSATENISDEDRVWNISLHYKMSSVNWDDGGGANKNWEFSVRCIKD